MILLLTHLYLCGVRAESDNVLHFSTCACHPSRVPMLENVTPLLTMFKKHLLLKREEGEKCDTSFFNCENLLLISPWTLRCAPSMGKNSWCRGNLAHQPVGSSAMTTHCPNAVVMLTALKSSLC